MASETKGDKEDRCWCPSCRVATKNGMVGPTLVYLQPTHRSGLKEAGQTVGPTPGLLGLLHSPQFWALGCSDSWESSGCQEVHML